MQDEIESYEKVLSLGGEESYYFTWYERALAHVELRQTEEAILCYTRFFELGSLEDQEDIADGARTRIIQLSEEVSVRLKKESRINS